LIVLEPAISWEIAKILGDFEDNQEGRGRRGSVGFWACIRRELR